VSVERKHNEIYPHIDKWQHMKKGRMACLLDEIEAAKEMEMDRFLGSISVKHGIREDTGREYIRDWLNAGCISVEKNVIKFVRKLD
jgi:NAD-dependent DNA ligase